MKKIVLFFLCCLSFFACKKDNVEPVNEGHEEVIISPLAKVVDSVATEEIVSVDTGKFTFVFEEGSSYASGLKVNDIMVSAPYEKSPYGYLRKVTAIQGEASSTTVTTGPAKLADVILQGSINLENATLGRGDISSIKLAKGFKLNDNLKSTELLGFDLEYEHDIGGNNDAKLTGSFYFSLDFNFQLDLGFDLSLDFVEVEYFKTSVEVDEMASIGLDVASACSISEEIEFASITFSPITIYVGIVPVVFVPEVELVINTDLNVSANLKTFATQNYNREIGLIYSEGDWTHLNNTDPAPGYTLQAPDLADDVNFNVQFGPEASLKLYGIAGPYVNLMLSSDMTTNKSTNGFNMEYNLGLVSNAGVKIEVLGFNLLECSKELFNVNLATKTLHDEPLEQSFTIKQPVNNDKIVAGEVVDIKTYTTGLKPDDVSFYIDDRVVHTDDAYPFDYQWITSDDEKGVHKIKAVANYGGTAITSEVDVELQEGGWKLIDLSSTLSGQYVLDNIYFLNRNHGWIVGRTISKNNLVNSCFVLYSSSGGETWTKVYEGSMGYYIYPSGYESNDLMFLNNDIGYFATNKGFYKTENGGHSWTETSTIGKSFDINKEGNLIRIDYQYLEILRSNGTGSWEILNDVPYMGDEIGRICFPENNTGYVILKKIGLNGYTLFPQIAKVTNDGANWTELIKEEPYGNYGGKFYTLDFVNNNTGWVVGYNNSTSKGIILKTTDGGASWNTLETSGIPHDILFLDNNTGYVAITHLTDILRIEYTRDGGATWHRCELPSLSYDATLNVLTANYPELFFLDKGNGWAVYQNNCLKYGIVGE